MDKYRIDSQKLLYHPDRVSDWAKGINIYPIYMEISLTSACNHRCVFCGLDFVGYPNRFLESGRLKKILSELGRLGVRSIMYAGEGEPFLHRDMADIVVHTQATGIDVAVATNGVLMTPDISEKILGATQWIRISCNAGTAATYAKIHRTRAGDFDKVIDNLQQAAALKRSAGHACTLGVQTLLLPENATEIEGLAGIVRDLGLDYLVVKPYSQHPQSRSDRYKHIHYGPYMQLAERLKKFNTDHFQVIFRLGTMQKWDEKKKPYQQCLALSFWSYVDALGNVWGCSVYLEDDRFRYGNIYEQNFQQIWEGEKRRKSMAFVENNINPASCRVNCRMDAINRYLWDLKHPPAHVNFI